MFAEVSGAVGEGLTARGEMDAALLLADRALSGLTGVDDARRMYALRVHGMVALYAGRLDDGFREHSEMLRLARLHDRPYEEGMALLGLAQSCTYAGHPDRGLAFADEQLRVAVSLRNPSMLALAWYDRAEALSQLDPAQALESYQRAVHLAEDAGSSFVEGIALVGLASSLGRSQDPQVALPVFRSIIARWRRMNVWHHQWTTLRNLVRLFVRAEDWETAAVLLGAIDARSTATPPFGNDADDMQAAAVRLQRGPRDRPLARRPGPGCGDVARGSRRLRVRGHRRRPGLAARISTRSRIPWVVRVMRPGRGQVLAGVSNRAGAASRSASNRAWSPRIVTPSRHRSTNNE